MEMIKNSFERLLEYHGIEKEQKVNLLRMEKQA
jgi:hypothetical protein